MDHVTSEKRRFIMQQVKQKNTGPEMAVRSLLHRLGYRFRIHRKDLPGTPDIVFPSRRLAIFVHGCFWHGHECKKGHAPKSRLTYWLPKIEGNKQRDHRNQTGLIEAGWQVEVVWQCETSDVEALKEKLIKKLSVQ